MFRQIILEHFMACDVCLSVLEHTEGVTEWLLILTTSPKWENLNTKIAVLWIFFSDIETEALQTQKLYSLYNIQTVYNWEL